MRKKTSSAGGITWTIAGERVALLAWPRAILMQLAHPLVAAGVAQHSGFRTAPFARLHSTVSSMRQLTFGSDEAAAATVRRIRGIHDRVNGTLRQATGTHRAETRYSAHDPALLLWVHATLLDSHVRVLEPILGAFSAADLDRYCDEAAPLVEALGATPDAVPRTWRQLQDYIAAQIDGGGVSVGAEARSLAPYVLRPRFSQFVWPLRRAMEAVTIGSLPLSIRNGYGFPWDDSRQRHQQRVFAALRRLRAVAPDRLARWPEARR